MTLKILSLSSYFKTEMGHFASAAPAMSAMINPPDVTGTSCTLTGFLSNEGKPFRFV
jgi:hypothetical protein